MNLNFFNDVDKTIFVLRDAAKWLLSSGKKPSKWWQLKNLNKKFLFQYAKPEEFYVGLVDSKPAIAAILQINQKAQDWSNIDKDKLTPALYIHWLCVSRDFAGKGFPLEMVNFASKLAIRNKVNLLRLDTNAKEKKLRKMYRNLGFKLAGLFKEDYRTTALYQKKIS